MSTVSTAAVALALSLAAGQASAQTEVEEIVVTGSFIAGTPEDAALPVDVISAAELEKQGSPSTTELIKSLTISGPVLGDSNQFSTSAQGAIGAGSINMRGLGPQRTLVLFNGRRFMSTDPLTGVDTNLIPTAAIGRVELLKDGAAATYGSDAIGGVINFITKKTFSGFEVSGEYRYVDGSDGEYNMSAAWGWQGERGSAFIAAGYQHRSELDTLDRDWAYQDYTTNPSGWSFLSNPGFYVARLGVDLPTIPGTPDPNYGDAVGSIREASCGAVGGYQGVYQSGASQLPACYYSYVPFANLIEETDRYQLYGELNFDLTDTTEFFLEGMYSKTDVPNIGYSPSYPPTQGPFGPGSTQYFAPKSNPYVQAFLAANPQIFASAAAAGAYAAVPTSGLQLTLWRPFASGGNPAFGYDGQKGERSYELFRIATGLKGEFDVAGGIGWDLAFTYSRNQAYGVTRDILINRLDRALRGLGGPNCTGATPGANGCEWLNPFSTAYPGNPMLGGTNPTYNPAQANSPALARWLYDDQIGETTNELYVVDLVFNGTTGFELPGGVVNWAAGAQWRSSEQTRRLGSNFYDRNITPCPVPGDTSCAIQTGPYMFLGQSQPYYVDESIYAVFGEMNLPILDNLNAALALRFEDYGGETGSTTNPKLSMKWDATDWFSMRGSVGTTFRGPTPTDRAPGGATGLSGIQAAGNAFKSVDAFGNSAIGPEQALTYSIGALFDFGDVRAMFDYWSIKLEDQIVRVPANVVANRVANGPGNGAQLVNCADPLRYLVTFSNNNACVQGVTMGSDISRVRSDLVNGPELKTSGIDATLDYSYPGDVFGGRLSLHGTVSYVLEYEQDAFIVNGVTLTPSYEAVGFANYDRLPGTIPEWRGAFYAEYDNGPHNVRATINHIDGVTDNRGPTVVNTGFSAVPCTVANAASTTGCQLVTFGQEVDAFTTLDLTYRVFLPWDTTLTASILNITDEDPSASRIEYSYDPAIGNVYGRNFKIGLRKKF